MNKQANLGLQKAVVVVILLAVLVVSLLVSYGPSGLLTNLGKLGGDVGQYLGDLLAPKDIDDLNDKRQIEDDTLRKFSEQLHEELQSLAESSNRPEQSCLIRLDVKGVDLDDNSLTLTPRGDNGIRFYVVEKDGKANKRITLDTVNGIQLCSIHGKDTLKDFYELYLKNTQSNPNRQALNFKSPDRITFTGDKLLIDGVAPGQPKLPYDDRIYLYYDSVSSTNEVAVYCIIPAYGESFDWDCDIESDLINQWDGDEEFQNLLDDDCIDDWDDAGGYISLPVCKKSSLEPKLLNNNIDADAQGAAQQNWQDHCGNGKCEQHLGETVYNCKKDCPAFD